MTRNDNEWAAEITGYRWNEVLGVWKTAEDRILTTIHFDTDANDFRDLLNCEAVRNRLPSAYQWNIWTLALDGQPAALCRLREVMGENK